MKKSLLSVSGIVTLLVIVLLVNGIGKNLFGRWYFDLTEDQLYSLSAGTKKILGTIRDPITLKYYFSKTESGRYPGVRLYGDRVADLLREYEKAGRGKIRLESYDPRPDSEEEEWAQNYGITPVGGRSGEQIFLGLVGVNAVGKEEAIPMFNLSRQEFLEYDITKLVNALVLTKKPVIAVMSDLPLKAPPSFPPRADDNDWFFMSQLAQVAEVKSLKNDATAIDSDVTTLILVHPKNLSEQSLYAVDQFVMHGGKLIVLVDPFCQADQPPEDPNNQMAGMMFDRSSTLNRLLSTWGVEMVEKKVVADDTLATAVNTGRGAGIGRFPIWLSTVKSNLNGQDVVTSALENVILAWAGALKIKPVDGVAAEPLIKTSKQSQLIEESSYRYGGGDPETLSKNFVASGEEQILAVRLRGKLKTNFPQGKPGSEANASAADHLAETKENGNVIVFGDVDFVSNRFSIAQQNILGARLVSVLNDNQALLQNAVENFLGSDELIGLRTRGRFTRDFTRVNELEQQARDRSRITEDTFEAKVNGVNQELAQLQASAGGKPGEAQAFNKTVLEKIKKLREERRIAQMALREHRRNLRQGVERLGTALFLINTFLIPLCVIALSIGVYVSKRRAVKAAKSKAVA